MKGGSVFCPVCGARLADEACFCPVCGAQVGFSLPSVETGSDLAGEIGLGLRSGVAMLSLSWEAMDGSGYFETLQLRGSRLAYARRINPRHGGERFPRGYFDECGVDLTEEERLEVGRFFAWVEPRLLEKARSEAAHEAGSWNAPSGGAGPSFSLFCEYADGRPPLEIRTDEPPKEAVCLRRFLDCVTKRTYPSTTLHVSIVHRRGRSSRIGPLGDDSFDAANIAFCGSLGVVRDAFVRCADGDREIEARIAPFENVVVLDVGISHFGSERICVDAHPQWERLLVGFDEPAWLHDDVDGELECWEFLVSKNPICAEGMLSGRPDGSFARNGDA